jgi:hypothetical protein
LVIDGGEREVGQEATPAVKPRSLMKGMYSRGELLGVRSGLSDERRSMAFNYRRAQLDKLRIAAKTTSLGDSGAERKTMSKNAVVVVVEPTTKPDDARDDLFAAAASHADDDVAVGRFWQKFPGSVPEKVEAEARHSLHHRLQAARLVKTRMLGWREYGDNCGSPVIK